MQLGGNSPQPAGGYGGQPMRMGPDPFRGNVGPQANIPSAPPAPAPPVYTAPIQRMPAPQMPVSRPVAPVAPPMMQTPANPGQVRQQLMTALTPRPRFNV